MKTYLSVVGNRFTKLLVTCTSFALLCALIPRTSGALIAYEGFNYAAGANWPGLTGGTGWNNAWQTNTSPTGGSAVFAGSLAYVDSSGNALLTSGGKGFLTGVNGTAQPNRDLTASRGADGTTTWISYLAVRQGPTTNVTANIYPRSANISLYSNTVERLAVGNGSGTPSNVWMLLPAGLVANLQTATNSFSQPNTLVVLRIDHKPGNDDAYLFVNPILGVEPATSTASAKSIGAFDYSFNRIRPFAGGNDLANRRPYAELLLDEIRMGETYADVAPVANRYPTAGNVIINVGKAPFFEIPVSEILAAATPGSASEANQKLFLTSVSPISAQGGMAWLRQEDAVFSIIYIPPANPVGTDQLTYIIADDGATAAGVFDPRSALGTINLTFGPNN